MRHFVIITITGLWNRSRTAPVTWSGIVEGHDPALRYKDALAKAVDAWKARWFGISATDFVVDLYYIERISS